MTAPPVELCGHRWGIGMPCVDARDLLRFHHECAEPADHPPPCRCRCSATTTREDN